VTAPEGPSLAPPPVRRARRGPTVGEFFSTLGLMAALPITCWAAFLVLATFVGNDYGPIMRKAIAWASASMLLLVVGWRRLDWIARILAVVLFVVDVLVVVEAIPRL
jgi:hypothetical protein